MSNKITNMQAASSRVWVQKNKKPGRHVKKSAGNLRRFFSKKLPVFVIAYLLFSSCYASISEPTGNLLGYDFLLLFDLELELQLHF